MAARPATLADAVAACSLRICRRSRLSLHFCPYFVGKRLLHSQGADSLRKWSITSATVVKRFTPPNLLSTPSLLSRSRTDERGSTASNRIPLTLSSSDVLASG